MIVRSCGLPYCWWLHGLTIWAHLLSPEYWSGQNQTNWTSCANPVQYTQSKNSDVHFHLTPPASNWDACSSHNFCFRNSNWLVAGSQPEVLQDPKYLIGSVNTRAKFIGGWCINERHLGQAKKIFSFSSPPTSISQSPYELLILTLTPEWCHPC